MSRDVLSPPLLRLSGNRCYRVNLIHEDFGGATAQQKQTNNTYVEQDLYKESDDDDENEAENSAIEELPNSMFKLELHVPSAFFGGLIGFKGNTIRQIRTETDTDITVPRHHKGAKKLENVVIKGTTKANINTARRKINAIILSLRKQMRPTHFVCVDLHESDIKEKYNDFKTQILEANFPGIVKEFFQLSSSIHLTLQTCTLLDDAERTKATSLLQSCSQYLEDLTTPFNIQITGLEIMNDDPSAVRVLYGRVVAPELQKFANRCVAPFIQSGLGFNQHERDDVKLHMTIMKVSYEKQLQGNLPKTFDAREILKQFGNFDFGTTTCNEVSLCVIGTTHNEGDFYKTTGTLKF